MELREKNNNVLKFYMLANELKNVIRTGWKEVEISGDRLESVAEHIYGCIILAIGLASEHNLDIDLLKVVKMITFKELEKVTLKEVTTRDYPTAEERRKEALETFTRITSSLTNQDDMLELLDEFNKRESKEARFAFQVGKMESDIQAKKYDLEGRFDLGIAKKDAEYYGEPLSSTIIPQMQNASDGWVLFDRQYYTDEVFKDLSEANQNLKTL